MTISNKASHELDIFVHPTNMGALVETSVDNNALIPSNPTRTIVTSSDPPQAIVVHSTEVNEKNSPSTYMTYPHTDESSSNDLTPPTDDDGNEIVTEPLSARKHRKMCKRASGVGGFVVGTIVLGPIVGVAAGLGTAHVVSKKMKKKNLKKERALSRARSSQVRAPINDFEPIKSYGVVA
eukprot:scaffold168110_cov58-Attheya_sp.AAC.1